MKRIGNFEDYIGKFYKHKENDDVMQIVAINPDNFCFIIKFILRNPDNFYIATQDKDQNIQTGLSNTEDDLLFTKWEEI